MIERYYHPSCSRTRRATIRLLIRTFRPTMSTIMASSLSKPTRARPFQPRLSTWPSCFTLRSLTSLMCSATLFFVLFSHLSAVVVHASQVPQLSDFPPWVALTTQFSSESPRWQQRAAIGIPVGAHAGYGTEQWVAFRSGMLLLADIKNASAFVMNDGNDTPSVSAICQDSRGPSTFYTTGGETGLLYAYDNSGRLQHVYNISNTLETPVFLSACVQTRYHLLILDALNPHIYSLPLVDDSTPARGMPAPTDAFEGQPFVGYRHDLSGDWEHVQGSYNAFGVEWSNDFNDTAYVINWDTGILYTIQLSPDSVDTTTRQVAISGAVVQFPGAVSLKFDSRNERILYITIPHLNAIAVLEIHSEDCHSARFLTYRTHRLSRGVVGVSEYGDFLYMVSAERVPGARYFSLVQTSRYFTSVSQSSEDSTPEPVYPAPSPTAFANRSEILAAIVATPFPAGSPEPASSNVDTSSPSPFGTPIPSSLPGGVSGGPGIELSSPTVLPNGSNSPVTDSSDSDDGSEDGGGRVFGDSPGKENSMDGGTSSTARECFPGNAMSETKGNGPVRMENVQIGDSLLSHWDKDGAPVFSPVILFTHRLPKVSAKFVKITVDNRTSVMVSEGHYVPVFRIHKSEPVTPSGSLANSTNQNWRSSSQLVASRDVRPGHWLSVRSGRLARVTRVDYNVRNVGLFNVQTTSGYVVVNGVMMSTYTTAVRVPTAHALLSPLRLMSSLTERRCVLYVLKDMCSSFRWRSLLFSTWLRSGIHISN